MLTCTPPARLYLSEPQLTAALHATLRLSRLVCYSRLKALAKHAAATEIVLRIAFPNSCASSVHFDMSSSIGSDIFALLSVLFISLFVLLLLRHYLPLRTTPAYLLVPVFFALALPISLVLLVPIDLASNARDPDSDDPSTPQSSTKAIWLPDGVLLAVWRVAYWLTFALTWFILPLLGEYVDSGARTPKEKMIYSLRSNARYQLIVLGCGVLGLVYVFMSNGFKGTSIKGLIMALAYCWALIQAIYLMGHGLVVIPKRLFKYASISGRLRRLQERAPQIHEKLEDAVSELQELEAQVAQLQRRKLGVQQDHQEWITDLAENNINRVSLPAVVGALPPTQSAPTVPASITDRYLADLGRRLVRARHKQLRFVDTWFRLVQDANETQAILESRNSKKLDSVRSGRTGRKRISLHTPFSRHIYHTYIIPGLSILLGAVLAVSSAFIIWSELVKHALPQLSVITYLVVKNPDFNASLNTESESSSSTDDNNKIPFVGQLISSLLITYMCLAALSALGTVRVWGNRALVVRNTYPESATWYAGQVAKLTVPLTFNFITFFPAPVSQPTAFYRFLGNLINLTPLGRSFENWFPIFILLPVAAALFNLYGRIGRWLSGTWIDAFMGGMGDEEDDENPISSFGTGSWREGRALIERELLARADADRMPLSDSARPSLDVQRGPTGSRYRDEPTLTLGNAFDDADADYDPSRAAGDARDLRGEAASQSAARQERFARDREQRDRLAAATSAAREEEGDENVFEGFAHRVKNTIDTVEAPEWFQKRPKWMGGQGDETDGGGIGGSRAFGRNNAGERAEDENEFTRTLGRLFGGKKDDGRVRL